MTLINTYVREDLTFTLFSWKYRGTKQP